MDPALQEQLLPHLPPEEEVELILRLYPGSAPPPRVRVVSRFGEVVTCRLRRRDIRAVYQAVEKRSLKAARPIREDKSTDWEAVNPVDQAVLPATAEAGRGAIVAVLDWGVDFAHPNFRRPDGSSRLLAIWDQSARVAPAESPQPFSYGKVHYQEDINRALRTPKPYAALGYHPASGDPVNRGAHGTHVLDIAGGNGRLGQSSLAAGADLIFVHLSTRNTGGRANLGDSVRLLEGLDFVRRIAGDRPLAINISAGRHGGPHDGQTLVEIGMDELLRSRPATMICQSVGNYWQAQTHSSGVVRPGQTRMLKFYLDPADRNGAELEIFYGRHDRLRIELVHPRLGLRLRSVVDSQQPIIWRNEIVGRVYHRGREPNHGRHHLNAFLYPGAPPGTWEVRLYGERVRDGRYYAWLERDGGCRRCQTRFLRRYSSRLHTNNTISNGYNTLVVGAYDPRTEPPKVASFSSQGPTVDGRVKPDLVAPGVRILAARSSPRHSAHPRPGLVSLSGTSMAAPHVTSAVARLLDVLPGNTPYWVIKNLVIGNTAPFPTTTDPMRVGGGRLCVERLLTAAHRYRQQSLSLMSKEMSLTQPVTPSHLQTAEGATASAVEDLRLLEQLDQEVLDAVRWSMFRLNTVRLALQEWEKWERGRRKEASSAAADDLRKYWEEGARLNYPGPGTAWSAVFISWIMRESGAGSSFRYSPAHWRYVAAAKQNRLRGREDNPFWAYRVWEIRPQLGDLVCNSRAHSGLDYDTVQRGGTTHCDLVVEKDDNRLVVLGGNVANSVAKKTLHLDADGYLDQRRHPRHFAILRTRVGSVEVRTRPSRTGGSPSNPHGIDIDKAIQYNRRYQRRYGWRSALPAIRLLLEIDRLGPSDAGFALAVAAYQARKNFPAHQVIGILGPQTWRTMQQDLPNLPRTRTNTLPVGRSTSGTRSRRVPPGFREERRGRGLIRYGGGRLDENLLRLRRQNGLVVSNSEIDLFQRIANVETGGNLQALNTWDSAVVSIGFLQLTLQHGKLQKWIQRAAPSFERYGIALDPAAVPYRWGRNNEQMAIRGVSDKEELRWGEWARRFYEAGLDPVIVSAEVQLAREYLQNHLKSLRRRLRKKGEPASTYKNFLHYYLQDPYVRGLFQASFNNLPVAATNGVINVFRQVGNHTQTALDDFIIAYRQGILAAYTARNDNGSGIVQRTRNGARLLP